MRRTLRSKGGWAGHETVLYVGQGRVGYDASAAWKMTGGCVLWGFVSCLVGPLARELCERVRRVVGRSAVAAFSDLVVSPWREIALALFLEISGVRRRVAVCGAQC